LFFYFSLNQICNYFIFLFMVFREATFEDITEMQVVRNAVKENTLSHPSLVPDEDYKEFIESRGKGWVCSIDDRIVGFAFADIKENNIWALFVLPAFEHKGIGKMLQKIMLNWYFDQGKEKVWLGTAFNTRAEMFYRKSGWKEIGTNGPKEIKFEMTKMSWELSLQR
jgi:GNAT superfamily N-acetyltransferase